MLHPFASTDVVVHLLTDHSALLKRHGEYQFKVSLLILTSFSDFLANSIVGIIIGITT